MPNSGKWHHCNNKWHGGFSWEKLQEWRTHLFVQKIAHVNWGKFWIGHAIRLVYAKGFGQFDWYHVSNPDQSFPLLVSRLPLACSSYDIPWVGREKLAEQGGSKIKWLPWLSKWKLLSTWRRGVDINWITDLMKQVPHVWTFFENLTTMKLRVKFHHSTRSTGSVNKKG